MSAKFETVSTARPPCRSISVPTYGPNAACSSKADENTAKNTLVGRPSPAAIGAPSTAGR